MKVTLSFNLPEDREEYEDTINGIKYKIQLDEIWELMFRPYYKHGYLNENLNNALQTPDGKLVFEELEQMYRQIKRDEI